MRKATYLVPLAIASAGIAMGWLGAVSVDDRARQELDARLEADANKLALVLQGLATSLESELVALAAIAVVGDDPIAAHRRYVESNDIGSAHALIDVSGPRPEVLSVASGQATQEELATTRSEIEQALGASAVRHELAELTSRGKGFSIIKVPDHSSVLVAGTFADGDRSYVDATSVNLGPAGAILAQRVGDVERFAFYVTEEPSAESVVISSTDRVPLQGTVAAESLTIGGQRMLVEVGGTARYVAPPLAVFLGWVAATLLLAWFVRLAMRQRDTAVAARDRAERAERRFRGALDASPDTILLWESDADRLTLLNRDSVFGHQMGDLDDPVAFLDLAHPEDREQLTGLCAQHEVPEDDGFDVRVRSADGEEAWAHIRLRSLPDDHGRGDVLAVVTDITEARRNEEQRIKLESDLQQAQRLESVGQLAGGIAHDFNNLLAAIASTAELVGDDVDDPRTRQDVEEILAATRRGAALTKRLLTFSRRTVAAHVPVDVNLVVDELDGLFRRTLGEHIDLELALAEHPLRVIGDHGEVEQVLLNLVVNARDAADGSGHHIRVSTARRDDCATIEVSDNGTGMPSDVLQRAFEPFFTTKSVDRGSGLGLAIVYGIVNRMGGRVSISSSVGVGTTIAIELPLAPDGEHEEIAEPAPGAACESTRTVPSGEVILLVEDEPAVRRAAARLLQRAGHEVRVAGDGQEAIDLVREGFCPTVLVTDVVLPGTMTGRDVAEELRTRLPGMHVVYASGYPWDVISADHLDGEGAHFIAKPFTVQALLDAVDGVEAPVDAATMVTQP
jgi:PAS domain S-box-containing protein